MSKNTQNIVAATVAIAITLSLVYVVDTKGNLHTLKPAEWAEVNKNPMLLDMMPTLKHNPTNVHGKGVERLSDEARRPLYIEVVSKGGKSTFKETLITPAPEAKTRVAGEKKEKVTKQEGPRTIYVVDEGGQLRSLDQAQFKTAQEDAKTLTFCKSLKHNPTCVEKSLVQGGLVSTEDVARPMYWEKAGKLQRIWSSVEAKAAAEKVAADVKVEAKAEAAALKASAKKSSKPEAVVEVTTVADAEVTA